MKHLVFDVNVLLDVFLNREGAEYAETLLAIMREGHIKGWFAASSLPIIEYVMYDELKKSGVPQQEARKITQTHLDWLSANFGFLSLNGSECKIFLNTIKDIEDALISIATRSLGEAAIVVSNDKAFDTLGQVKVLGAKQFLEAFPEEREHTTNLQFVDLSEQQRQILPDVEYRIATVLRHGKYILGPEVKELEKRLAAFAGVKHCISCSSGTDALLMALMAYGIGPGDAIFTTPFTFIATAEVIALLGAIPVFVDIDPRTFNIDPEKLEQAIQAVRTNNTTLHPLPSHPSTQSPLIPRGVIPVDLFGLPADYDRIMAVAEKYGLFVLEDAAQSFGAEYKGRRAGSLGHVAATSFFPAKPFGCYGDGGAILTDDDGLAEKLVSIRVHGKRTDKYDNIRIGINGRLDTLQAAILLSKLEIFPEEIRTRQEVAEGYGNALRAAPLLLPPMVPVSMKSVWAQYSVLASSAPQRSYLQEGLRKAGIPTMVYYPKPLHMQTAFASLGHSPAHFPISVDCSERIFSLPMHPYLLKQNLQWIGDVISRLAVE